MTRARSLAVVALAILVVASLHGQSPDGLRARARAEGGEAKTVMGVDFSMFSVPELTQKAEVIVYGRVTKTRPHLTANESTVVTDITISPTRVLKQKTLVSSRQTPGVMPPLIVRHVGGTVVDGALKMSTIVDAFPEGEKVALMEEVICFLIYDPSEAVFELVDGPFAIFRVQQGEVRSFTKNVEQRLGSRGPASLDGFLGEVNRHLRTR